jgi:predicted anti-sigma-YlaC factor YlaD
VRGDHVREHLAEHLLGTLDESTDAVVRRHLRGCASCRAERNALGEGVNTFAVAAHDLEPPEELRGRILSVLEEEWAEAPGTSGRGRPSPAFSRLAAAAAIVVSLAWAGVATVQVLRSDDAADKYESLLATLGGEDVRVGELRAAGTQDLRGSVVIYDSSVGQSWVLVLVRAPGHEGTANVTMVADGEKTIDLRPMEFDPGGEGSTWLVTATDLRGYDRVNLWDEGGLIASASVEHA